MSAPIAEAQSGRFVLNGGEAYDRQTGLTWKRCMYGLAWNGRACAGQARGVTWFDAMAMQDGTWRLPTLSEMKTLFVDRPGYPKLDIQAFPDANGHPEIQYWTSSKLNACLENGNRPCAEVVMFNGDGGAYIPFDGAPGISYQALRMVRRNAEARPVNPAASAAQPPLTQTKTVRNGRWIIRGGEAFDTTTNLTWQRCNADLTYAGELGCRGVPRTYTFADARKLEGGGWRLPVAKELESIFYRERVAPGMPLLDPEVFLNLDPNRTVYWTTTSTTPGCATCRGPYCAWTCEYDATGQQVSKGVFCGYFDLSGTMACQKTELKVARLVHTGH